jgi:2-amino-4-hydroxy-6-hydroxymethyldihydropteridine diphosphokinase
MAVDVVFVGLGSNLGNRLEFLRRAVRLLSSTRGCRLRKVSSVYETEPVGVREQAPFLNAVVEMEVVLDPAGFFRHCQEIEADSGRQRGARWGPRTLDIDILSFGDRVMATERLTIPHPELHRRRFVLVPWAEIAPQHVVAGHGKSVAELLRDCPDPAWVIRYGSPQLLQDPEPEGNRDL